ncbi:putative Zn-dependent peptidase [Nocardioides albertanoniae]|uniref:Putative Zn-dependent peptidase n=1 Tax=Nocardioides albertanoniae TaxID=1175486 RepID=A0A543A9Q7_9ACTN|nr:pitrilysin family protein [Nocardioides albertanoniae]TQL69321.1 putative Zn-dependent peptidase [Nocardioides albertanoniae]
MASRNTQGTGRQEIAGRSSGYDQEAGTTVTLEQTEVNGAVTSLVRRTVHPSGLRIVTEQMAGVRSAAIGVFIGVGSRDETEPQHGCSHFLEHLLFKGTPSRTALEISNSMDRVGGEFNAYTAKEYTCFHARVLDADLPLAVDVVGDMVTSSLLTADDVEAERDVILDEIAMHDDDPDDVIHNLVAEQAWGATTPLGRGIAGTEASISALDRESIHGFYREHYVAPRMVVSVAGNLDHDTVVTMVEKAFGGSGFLDARAAPRPPRDGEPLGVAPGEVSTQRPLEQVNLIVAREGLRRGDERRFAFEVVNTAVGGSTSSRLFQEIREHRGLAYSVFSYAYSHAETGLFGVQVGALPSKVEEVLEVVRSELAAVARDGITADEIELAKGQLRGGLVLGLEDSAARMSRIGRAELVHRELYSIDEVLERIDAVTAEECREIAAEILTRPEILAVVGPA